MAREDQSMLSVSKIIRFAHQPGKDKKGVPLISMKGSIRASQPSLLSVYLLTTCAHSLATKMS